MLMKHSNMYAMTVAGIHWELTQVIMQKNVVYRTYEGTYKKLKIIRKTMQERFSDGSGWKSPKEKYICDGGVWDTAVKMGVYLKTLNREEKEQNKRKDE